MGGIGGTDCTDTVSGLRAPFQSAEPFERALQRHLVLHPAPISPTSDWVR